ncbi:MAG: hypothetical protein ACUVQG_05165 [Thermogutta sp.]
MVIRLVWIVLIVVVCAIVLLGIAIAVLYLLASRAPAFYIKKLPLDQIAAKKASDQFLQKTSMFASDLKREGTWYLKVTEEEINGWLATDLPRNHAQSLPPGMSDPRIEIADDVIRIAAKMKYGILSGVAHAELKIYSAETNTIIVVIRRAAIGVLPLPLQKFVESLETIAARADWNVRQMQSGGSPTLVIIIPNALDEKGRELELTNIYISEGQVELSGKVKLGKKG